jgi:single-stranded-DNA-specific exonuclease
MNQQRQEMEKLILDDIEHLKQQAPSWFKKKSLVLDSKNWHEGILGIVASRLVSQFHRPVVLISTRGGIGKGSCRSIPGLDLHMGLCRCGDCLLGFGGHAMAAGLTLHPERIQEFRARFEDYVQEQLNDTDLTPQITVDLRMSFDDITENLIDELERLRPFGPENPEPLFLTENLRIVDSKIVGEQHRRMLLCQADSLSEKKITAFQFHADPLTPPHQTIEWAVFRLRWNRWNGTKQAQMIIEDLEYFS